MIVVVTALIGPTESIAPPKYPHVRHVCFTDRKDVLGWRCLPAPKADHPRRAARIAKISLHEYFPDDITIWIDASFDLIADPEILARDATATGCVIVGFPHPDRSRISDEAKKIISLGMVPAEMANRQIKAYQDEGFDTDADPQTVITTGGLLVRMPSLSVMSFNCLWLEQINRYTMRDQLSIDYCAWKLGLRIGHLEGFYTANAYANYNRSRHARRRVVA